MREWEISAPYVLPRITPLKRRRSNTLPTKILKPAMRVVPFSQANTRWTVWRRSDYFYPEMIPEPDYSESSEEASSNEDSESDATVERLRDVEEEDEKEEDLKRRKAPLQRKSEEATNAASSSTNRQEKPPEDGLIKPKKPSNPYLESSERLKLHKELKFSQKYGKRGVNPKSELQMALEKYAENKMKRNLASSKQTSLDEILQIQAKKIERQEREGMTERKPSWIDRLQLQQNTSWPDPKTDEFYRVHARVVCNLMDNMDLADDAGDHRLTKSAAKTPSSASSKTSESSDLDSSD